MYTFLRPLLGLLIASCLVTASLAEEPSPEPPDPANDAKKLQGTWVVERFEADGKALPVPVKELRFVFTFEKDKVKMNFQNMVKSSRLKLDTTKKPAQIDVTDEDTKKVSRGIFKIEKNELTFAFGQPDGARPKNFDGSASTPLMVLRRQEVAR